MKTTLGKSFVGLSWGFVLALCFAGAAAGQGPGPVNTNRLETGGNYQIAPPPSNMMFKITNNETNAGDDNLIWSNSGRMLAVDRSDPAVSNMTPKYICLLDVRNLGNVQVLGARSSAVTNPMYCNITAWTWNDDRVIFGSQPQVGNPPVMQKVRLVSCTATGPVSVTPFLMADPQGNPTNHVYSPSVVFDPAANKERLLFIVSSVQGDQPTGDSNPNTRLNLYTVTFDHGGVPNWNDRVPLTAFNNNISISSVKWCPELGTNYQPICNRLVMLIILPGTNEQNRLIVLNDVQGIIANPATAPTNLTDPRFIVVETNLTMNSQVSWTFDGQYVMYGRMVNNPPAPPASDLYSKRADSPTNTAVKFETPAEITGGQKQWLSISPDGMKAAFTVDHKIYVIPLQFDNVAVTGAVVTNILTDASYTAVDVPGNAIPSNTTFSIVAPPSVDTNNFNGEFSGYAREFSVSGVSSQFDLATNATMTLHFSQADIPSGASATNLAIYVYNPQGTNAGGPTGTWDQLASVINTNSQTISAEVQHFSIYAIGRASAQPEGNPPLAPTGVSASKGTYTNMVRITWNSVSNATSYQVWRNTANASNYSATMLNTQPTVSNLDDATAEGSIVYYYWVKAKNAVGTSDFSSADSGYAMDVHNVLTGDFDGDRKADPATVDGSDWYVWFSASSYTRGGPYSLGQAGWTAVAGDIDGDGKADLAMVDTSGNWYVWFSGSGYAQGGPYALSVTGGRPIAGDFDGDGKADPAMVDTSGNWYVWFSGSGYAQGGPYALSVTGGRPVAGDFDGDGKADPTMADTSGNWYVWFSGSSYARGGPYSLQAP